MATRKPQRPSRPQRALFVELKHVRESAYMLESAVAGTAGVTVALYRAMESGVVPITQKVYDTVVSIFPALKAYPRPAPDPDPIKEVKHPVLEMEQLRMQDFHSLFKQLNVGRTNRRVFRKMLLLASEGIATTADIEHYFGE